jgi:hypothetical protein
VFAAAANASTASMAVGLLNGSSGSCSGSIFLASQQGR